MDFELFSGRVENAENWQAGVTAVFLIALAWTTAGCGQTREIDPAVPQSQIDKLG